MELNRINFAKLQLFRYVDELFVRLCDLVSPQIEEAMNMPSHGLDRQELIVLLYQLFKACMLVAMREDRNLFTPTLEEIEAALEEKPDLLWKSSNTFYGMTTTAHERFRELKRLYDNQHKT